MRRALTAALVIGILALVPVSTLAQDQDHVIEDAGSPSFLFVLSAASGSVEGDTLTLDGVPSVIYFSDRPARIAGHQSVASFVAGWDVGSDSFSADPPNAVLAVLGEGDDVVVEITSVALDGNDVLFDVLVIEGTLPEGSFGPASLFIDPRIIDPHFTD